MIRSLDILLAKQAEYKKDREKVLAELNGLQGAIRAMDDAIALIRTNVEGMVELDAGHDTRDPKGIAAPSEAGLNVVHSDKVRRAGT